MSGRPAWVHALPERYSLALRRQVGFVSSYILRGIAEQSEYEEIGESEAGHQTWALPQKLRTFDFI